MNDKNNHDENLKVAGNYYNVSDYKSNSVLSSGFATTHEQVSDAYFEGTVDAVIDDLNGKDVKIPQEGYEEKK
jgi:hypothetical protein